MPGMRYPTVLCVTVFLLAMASPMAQAPADPTGPYQVTYTVTTTSDLTANIYYVTSDPPGQASANDPQYMPLARTGVGPGAPWVNPEFRCEIAVDGQVLVSTQGGSGVQCALRPW